MSEQVYFTNCRGQKLAGLIDGELSDRAVICCHGMLSTKNGTKHQYLAELIAGMGIAVLRFDFAGRGDSEGRLFDLTYSNEMEDLYAAVEFLAGRGVERLGLFGSSMGGAIALMGAAREERFVAIATLAAVAHTNEVEVRHPVEAESWKTHGYADTEAGRIGKAFYEDALEHNVLGAVRVLRAPILVLHGDLDEVVPPLDAHDIAVAARNVSLEIVQGADHRFSNPVHLRPAMRAIAAFLVGHLR
ncbi:MAG: hypothetical protein A2289_06825 [Deltaproteobacteria bacterium RIFOXYA12_FULL_58_15]|nr:MAG: hypothetical protein A2289_06825 [Deltaproteobacteria bacterium RIFOXYA12_FULL_58_15]OGR14421.1 MAG: hypothetical protein A2341_04705 [Deltaproteobacteria bacterium RIFOXYB12_FULL_58_9]